jgi:nucleoside-diphosphate-sugar epimerase
MDDTFVNNFHTTKNPGNKVFITGATGLVGSHLLQELLRLGYSISALYRSTIPDVPGKEKVEWVKGDISDILLLEEVLVDVSEVYHCAAKVSFNASDKEELLKTNVEGTANVVNAAINRGVRKFCYVSSVASLGKGNKGQPISEDTVWNSSTDNTSVYAASKYHGEMEVWRGIGEGLHAVIVNPAIILGAANWNDSSTKIFKTAYEEFPWYTEGVTGFVDVKDVVNAMIRLMNGDISGERFILSAENKTYKEVFTTIATSFDKKPPHKKVTSIIANVVWRLEAIRSLVTKEKPLLTKETAAAAQDVMKYSNNKLLETLPSFEYTPIKDTIDRVTKQLKEAYNLP